MSATPSDIYSDLDARASGASGSQSDIYADLDARAAGKSVPPTQSPSTLRQWAMAPVGAAEEFGKLATGAVAAIPAGLAYGGAAVGKAFGADVNPG